MRCHRDLLRAGSAARDLLHTRSAVSGHRLVRSAAGTSLLPHPPPAVARSAAVAPPHRGPSSPWPCAAGAPPRCSRARRGGGKPSWCRRGGGSSPDPCLGRERQPAVAAVNREGAAPLGVEDGTRARDVAGSGRGAVHEGGATPAAPVLHARGGPPCATGSGGGPRAREGEGGRRGGARA